MSSKTNQQTNMSAKQLEARISQLEKLVSTLNEKTESLTISESTTKVKKEKSTVNKDGTPKKPKAKTGYLIFSSEKREDIKKMLQEENGEPPKPKDVISKLGAVWKALTDDDKKVFNDKAKLLAEEAESNTSD